MSAIVIRLESEHPPEVAWARLWDLERHSALIPLTTVALEPPSAELGEGIGFIGRTAVGPVGFDDPMRILEWSPPPAGDGAGRAVVAKVGRVVGGRIEVTVSPLRSGSEVVWRQEVRLPWLPLRLPEALAARIAAPGYRHVLRSLVSGR